MTLPRFEPMLATPWPGPFADPDWWFEVKWDGVRIVLTWDGSETTLRSRAGNDVTATYPELDGIGLSQPCVLDGEVVALDHEGRPSFGRLQQRMHIVDRLRVAAASALVPITFVAFDILYDGGDVTGLPIEERLQRLRSLSFQAPAVRTEPIPGDGVSMWSFVETRRLEGMVAKRRGSRYRPGIRSPDWRKVARRASARVVVGGFSAGTGGRSSTFGALVVGLWTDEGLRWCGSLGTGFDDPTLRAIRDALDQMVTDVCPFLPSPDLPDATWVEPELVALVEFKEWTAAGRLRAPSFKGFAAGPASGATWEEEGPGPA